MKELINEFKGVKEPMHTIMEENEEFEQSVIGTPVLSDNEEPSNADDGCSQSESSMAKDSSFRNTSMSSKLPLNEDYHDKDYKDGRLLFSYMRGDVAKSMPIKSASSRPDRPDLYLDRITFIGRKMVNIWFGREISIEHFNLFVDLLKDRNYLVSFPIMLEAFRKLNYFEIQASGYQHFCELILGCLTEVTLAHQSFQIKNVTIPLSLLNMASTYYAKDPEGRISYLMDGVKKHAIFTADLKFWETCILFKNTCIKSDEKTKSLVFLGNVVRNILSVTFHMNDIFNEKQLIRDVATRFLTAYKIQESQAADLIAYLQSLGKKEPTKK